MRNMAVLFARAGMDDAAGVPQMGGVLFGQLLALLVVITQKGGVRAAAGTFNPHAPSLFILQHSVAAAVRAGFQLPFSHGSFLLVHCTAASIPQPEPKRKCAILPIASRQRKKQKSEEKMLAFTVCS